MTPGLSLLGLLVHGEGRNCPQGQGSSTSIFNFLSLSDSQESGPLALRLDDLDWVSDLTSWPYFSGNPTRLKHSHAAEAGRKNNLR